MALYQGLNSNRNYSGAGSGFRGNQNRVVREKYYGKKTTTVGWLEKMLGTGSSEKLRSRRTPVRKNIRVVQKSRRENTGFPRGMIRLAMGMAVIVWVFSVVGPVHTVKGFIAGLNQESRPVVAAKINKAVTNNEAVRPSASDMDPVEDVVVKNLPWIDFNGKAVALWKGGSGSWYQVNREGFLRKCDQPEAIVNLGLPVLDKIGAEEVEYKDGRSWKLQGVEKKLSELLPLHVQLISEVADIQFGDGSNPVLITHTGTQILLGENEWKEKQARAAMVLADLNARRKKVGKIDLRFKNSAVVRLK